MNRSLLIDVSEAGQRLDHILARQMPELSRAVIQRLIVDGHVSREGKRTKASDRARTGDRIEIEVMLAPSLSAAPEPIALDIVYEDDDIAVINKPAGFVVHPAAGHFGGTLVNALTYRYPHMAELDGVRPGIVHRLDKDTSGLLVVALTAGAQVNLARQIKECSMAREYVALVAGQLPSPEFLVDAPIGRDLRSRRKMAVGPDTIRPRDARTRIYLERYVQSFAQVRALLETGRTHQIRVHLAYIGHPVAGDSLYGGARIKGLSRQFLHARALELDVPRTGTRTRFESEIPEDLQSVLTSLEFVSA